MKIEEFHEILKTTFLYPGSIDDLNKNEKLFGSGKHYELIPISGCDRFVKGIIFWNELNFPSGDSIEPDGVSDTDFEEIILHFDELFSEKYRNSSLFEGEIGYKIRRLLKPLSPKKYGRSSIIDYDIRTKAHGAGAEGLVDFQVYVPRKHFPIYMGLPVRETIEMGRAKPTEL